MSAYKKRKREQNDLDKKEEKLDRSDGDGLSEEAPSPDKSAGDAVSPSEQNASKADDSRKKEGKEKEKTIPLKEYERLVDEAKKKDEIFEKLQRKVAEFDNYQKRVRRDRSQWEEHKLKRFMLDFFPAIDDLSRIRDALEGDIDLEEVRKVFSLFEGKINKILADWKIEKIKTVGENFDPAVHEALRQQETDEMEEGKVLFEVSGGYTLNENILKAAKVIVAANADAGQPEDAEGEGAGGEEQEVDAETAQAAQKTTQNSDPARETGGEA